MFIPHIGNVFFKDEYLILLIIPLFFILLYLLNKNFVKLDQQKHKRKIARRGRILLLLSRTFIIGLLLLALASPYTLIEEKTEGNPRISLLVDNSTSMSIYDLSFIQNMKNELSKEIPTTIKEIGVGNMSSISEGIYSSLDTRNIILVTDGQNYRGKDLRDTLLLGRSQNVSLTLIDIKPKKSEISTMIEGPSKVVEDVENEYTILINKVLTKSVNIKVEIDGKVEINKNTNENSITITKAFSKGQHKIVARVSGDDTFKENNVYYKTINVIEKPNILYLTKKFSPVTKLLDKLYNLDIQSTLPKNLDKYLAVIVNDYSVYELQKENIDALSNYANLGDGLIFIGGENSFEYGDYKGNYIETLLPVKIAKGTVKPSKDVSVVILIDKSGSTGAGTNTGKTGVSHEKEIALQIIDQIDNSNYIGVIAFNQDSEIISRLVPKSKFDEVKQKIIDIKSSGSTNMEPAFKDAVNMLKDKEGSRNIIIISDGQDRHLPNYIGLIIKSAKDGIVTDTVNIGANSNKENMMSIAKNGNGKFFSPTDSSGVNVVFSKPENKWPLMILPKNHFITNNLKLKSYISGFNQVVPKTTSMMLATTVYGDPLLITGRYGLGRIAVLATDDGSYWSSNVLKEDPKFISKIVNWAIENPERKKDSYIEIPDSRVGEDTVIYVKNSKMPEEKGFLFSKIDSNLYKAQKESENIGFNTALGKEYAINYHPELENFGINKEMLSEISSMGNNIYSPSETEKIISAAKQSSIEVINTQISLRNYLIYPALLILLLEVVVRRIFRYRKLYK